MLLHAFDLLNGFTPYTASYRPRSFERAFGALFEAPQAGAATFPAMNLATTDTGVVVEAVVPGMSVDSITIEVSGKKVTLSGSRSLTQEGATIRKQEVFEGSFERSFELPFLIDENKVEATYSAGILRVSLPKAESEKPRKIPVKLG